MASCVGRVRKGGTLQDVAHETSEYHVPAVYSIHLGDRGRLVLPSVLRQRLNWQPGERLIVTLQPDSSLRVIDARRLAREMRGIYSHLAPRRSLVDELIADRRKDAARERAEDKAHGRHKRS